MALAMTEDLDFWQLILGMGAQDEDNICAGPTFLQAWKDVVSLGLMPGIASFGPFTGHRADTVRGDGRSVYSTGGWDILRAQDWFSVDVEMHLML